jgi:hypothetical protein
VARDRPAIVIWTSPGSRPDAARVHILRRLGSDAYLSRRRGCRPPARGAGPRRGHRPPPRYRLVGRKVAAVRHGGRRHRLGREPAVYLLSALRPRRRLWPGVVARTGLLWNQPGLRGVDGVRWIRGATAYPTTDLPNSATDLPALHRLDCPPAVELGRVARQPPTSERVTAPGVGLPRGRNPDQAAR